MGVKLDLSPYGKNTDRGCLRTECRGGYLEIAGGWRKLHNEELRNLYSLLNIVHMIKSRVMRWARHVGCMEEMRSA
jgi:hypothetical protein